MAKPRSQFSHQDATPSAQYPQHLRAITIHAPFALGICLGEKEIEYRPWSTPIRGWVFIHVGTSCASDDLAEDLDELNALAPKRAIIGAAQVVECIPDPEEDGGFYHCLDYPLLFPTPVPDVRGQLNYWSAKSPEQIAAFNAAWEALSTEALEQYGLPLQQYQDTVTTISTSLSTNLEDYFLRGCAYSELTDYQAAIQDFNQVVEGWPDHVEAFYQRGHAYFRSGHLEDALADYLAATHLDPDFVEAYQWVGYTYAHLHQFESALESYNNAWTLDPDDLNTLRERASVYANCGSIDLAILDYRAALSVAKEQEDTEVVEDLELALQELMKR